MEISLRGYGILSGGISKQAVSSSIQKKGISSFQWFRRRLKNIIIPQSVSLNTRCRTGHNIVKNAKHNLEVHIGNCLNASNKLLAHQRMNKPAGRPSGCSPRVICKGLGIDFAALQSIRRNVDIVDILEAYGNKLISQLIELGESMMSCPEDKWLASGKTVRDVIDLRFMPDPKLQKSLSHTQRSHLAVASPTWTDPFMGAFNR